MGRFSLAFDDKDDVNELSKANINIVSYSQNKIGFSKLQEGKQA